MRRGLVEARVAGLDPGLMTICQTLSPSRSYLARVRALSPRFPQRNAKARYADLSFHSPRRRANGDPSNSSKPRRNFATRIAFFFASRSGIGREVKSSHMCGTCHFDCGTTWWGILHNRFVQKN